MRTAAEARRTAKSLVWFFDQWVRGTGLLDYAYGGARTADAEWTVRDDSARRAPRRVAARDAGRRADLIGLDDRSCRPAAGRSGRSAFRRPNVRNASSSIRTTSRGTGIGETTPRARFSLRVREPRIAYNWPYLNQVDLAHTLSRSRRRCGTAGRRVRVLGVRAKTNYLSTVDIHDGGIAFSARNPHDAQRRQPEPRDALNVWARAENLYLPGVERPLMGIWRRVQFRRRTVSKSTCSRTWDLQSVRDVAAGPTIECASLRDAVCADRHAVAAGAMGRRRRSWRRGARASIEARSMPTAATRSRARRWARGCRRDRAHRTGAVSRVSSRRRIGRRRASHRRNGLADSSASVRRNRERRARVSAPSSRRRRIHSRPLTTICSARAARCSSGPASTISRSAGRACAGSVSTLRSTESRRGTSSSCSAW